MTDLRATIELMERNNIAYRLYKTTKNGVEISTKGGNVIFDKNEKLENIILK